MFLLNKLYNQYILNLKKNVTEGLQSSSTCFADKAMISLQSGIVHTAVLKPSIYKNWHQRLKNSLGISIKYMATINRHRSTDTLTCINTVLKS